MTIYLNVDTKFDVTRFANTDPNPSPPLAALFVYAIA
jgi:hypothetical protein